jgi:transposase
VQLANRAVDLVRRRVTAEQRGRRGRKVDPEWRMRRRLLTAWEKLEAPRFAAMWNACIDTPGGLDVLAARIAKEELRALLALARTGATRHEIAHARYRFAAWCAEHTHIAEILTLAETIDTWWNEAFIDTGITNARTEGLNRLVKQVNRTACGFRNPVNRRRRVRYACTRQSRRMPA